MFWFSQKSTIFAICALSCGFLGAFSAEAHRLNPHNSDSESHASHVERMDETVLKEINVEYLKLVRPIFQKNCFNCHSETTEYPWYAKFPGVRWLIERDIKEARTHLDLSGDFPFKGHGTPLTDLEAIRNSIDDRSMPPLRYKVMHWSSNLSENEAKTIVFWINQSLAKLKSNKPR